MKKSKRVKLPRQVEEENQMLIRAGEVVDRLHVCSELKFIEVDVRAGLSERNIRRIRKGQTNPSIIDYNNLLESYFVEAGGELNLQRLLALLPQCLAKRQCLVVSIVDSKEVTDIPAGRVIVVWKD